MLVVGDVLAITEYFVVVDAPEPAPRAHHRRRGRGAVCASVTGRSPIRVEGGNEQQWVLIDFGDIVVHVFLDEIRRFYEIERLYRDVAQLEWATAE